MSLQGLKFRICPQCHLNETILNDILCVKMWTYWESDLVLLLTKKMDECWRRCTKKMKDEWLVWKGFMFCAFYNKNLSNRHDDTIFIMETDNYNLEDMSRPIRSGYISRRCECPTNLYHSQIKSMETFRPLVDDICLLHC